MKRRLTLIILILFIATLVGCSAKQDTLKFINGKGLGANTQCVDFEVNIGHKVGGVEVIAELWQDGACIKSTPVIINNETKNIGIILSVDGYGTSKDVKGINVQIDTNEKSGSALTYFELPSQIMGYSFTAYDNNEVIKVNPEGEVILAAMAFDSGTGVRSFDCKGLIDEPDKLLAYSCILIIRASFTAEKISNEQNAKVQS